MTSVHATNASPQLSNPCAAVPRYEGIQFDVRSSIVHANRMRQPDLQVRLDYKHGAEALHAIRIDLGVAT